MTSVQDQARLCKSAAPFLARCPAAMKNAALRAMALELERNTEEILSANGRDLASAREMGATPAFLDRLSLTRPRLTAMAQTLRSVSDLPDPVGQVLRTHRAENGLLIEQRRVPLGVVGVIYEARPNVTVDVAALCLKAGNAVLLRGGKEALESNLTLGRILAETLKNQGFPAGCVEVVRDTSRSSATEMMGMTDLLDVLIPRGGRDLIRTVAGESRVPVIRTGEGVCHIYVDESADLAMAKRILLNAKCSRPSVCNACECVVVHRAIAPSFWAEAGPLLAERGVELRCDKATQALVPQGIPASDEDWDSEYGELILACKIVEDLPQAIAFINAHSTGHSEAIISQNSTISMDFVNKIDAAAVYVNASTRFTDGFEFGLGAEIGISTQKMHARGPMGLEELTTWRYVIHGTGQVR